MEWIKRILTRRVSSHIKTDNLPDRLHSVITDGDREQLLELINVCKRRADATSLLQDALATCRATKWHALTKDLESALSEIQRGLQGETLNHTLLKAVPTQGDHKFLDPCELKAVIGEGGMGVVFRAFHRNLSKDVAIKVLDSRYVNLEHGALERFRLEARMAFELQSDNIVRFFDIREAFGLHYIVMELVDGLNAREWVASKGAMIAQEASRIGKEAAKGLAAAHKIGLIHRDVKPDNILIPQQGEAKISDLGLVNAALKPSLYKSLNSWRQSPKNLTLTGTLLGTPLYMAPEQWEMQSRVSPATDVWALGATLYFLLSGKDPHIDGEPVGLKSCSFPDIRKAIPSTPRSLARVIAKATEKLPTDRYSDAREFGDALASISSHKLSRS